ncbi:MAG: hypothetical protein DHS20C17_23280 [Cyclobacteriaceae bacterium]|nr:MAG: hypothetical protein DHS20C17_23280 [Cyclobacteriaceae bacterium]
MTTESNIRQLASIISWCFTILILSNLSVTAQDTGLVVIGNKENVPSELERRELISVLRGEQQRWKESGGKVVLALMEPDTPIGRNVCTRVYNMSGNELQKYFLLLVFQGKARAPNYFDSAVELEAFVAKTPGAIGVVNQNTNRSVKTVLVDGNSSL